LQLEQQHRCHPYQKQAQEEHVHFFAERSFFSLFIGLEQTWLKRLKAIRTGRCIGKATSSAIRAMGKIHGFTSVLLSAISRSEYFQQPDR